MPVSAPPASPSVTMQYVTATPASPHAATPPANPKSTSSGCARTNRMRSTPSRETGSTGGKLSPVSFESRELVGLLADDNRRRVFAALVLGSSTLADVRRATGLDARDASRALQRLVDAGLVLA